MNIGSLFHTPIESQIPQWVKELKVKSPYMKKIRVDDCICHGKLVDHIKVKDRILKEIEYPLIALSLSSSKGNQLKASKLLGINRNTLRKKISELDINVSQTKKMM